MSKKKDKWKWKKIPGRSKACASGFRLCGPPIADEKYGNKLCKRCVESFKAEARAHVTHPHLF